MGIFDFFNKKQKGQPQKQEIDLSKAKSKEELFRMAFAQVAQQSPSEMFARGAVFDYTRAHYDQFKSIVRANDALALWRFFMAAYGTYCNNPGSLGLTPAMVNPRNNDTNPANWNADTFTFPDGCAMGLCFMPIDNDKLEARIIGIVVNDNYSRDGYYYCMLDKDKDLPSEVRRNNMMLGSEKVGEVKGRGFDLMDAFRDLIKENYTASTQTLYPDHL